MIDQLRPKAQSNYRALPILGKIAEAFLVWSHRQGYSRSALGHFLADIKWLDHFFRRRGVKSLRSLQPLHFESAWRRYREEKIHRRGTIHQLHRFLIDQGILVVKEPPKSPSEQELMHLEEHLSNVRGLAKNTVTHYVQLICRFLRFLRFDSAPAVLGRLEIKRVETFMRHAARTNSPASLHQIAGYLRGFFRFQYAKGAIHHPLHLQINMPRVYRPEPLPRTWTLDEVQGLLQSIDCSNAQGLRDFTVIYLAAAYGLRRRELAQLTLDDIDWRQATIQIVSTKNRQTLRLPLTDEAGDILQQYLRRSRGTSVYRELFLRTYAPPGKLQPSAIAAILDRCVRKSGLDISFHGIHALRHAFAVRLLRQGVPIKTIGDTLGHRHPKTTGVYLRLSVEDLRAVGLAVPATAQGATLLPPQWRHDMPRVRAPHGHRRRSHFSFRSHWAASLRRYLATKQAFGCQYIDGTRALESWDAFVCRSYPHARVTDADMIHGWAEGLTHLCPTVRNRYLCVLRNFLLFHVRDHEVGFIPETDSFPRPLPHCTPRVVSDAEMAKILATTSQLPPCRQTPLRAEKAKLAFILLFCCGLRRGELLRLKIDDIDLAQRLLRIESTKFHKSRLVPMSDSVFQALQDYLDMSRRKKISLDAGSFLIWSRGHPRLQFAYTGPGLKQIWQHVCLSAGIVDKRGRAPRIHDLRHSFAVNALQRWYMQNVDVQSRLQQLATYMGHVSPIYTYHYLQLTPQLGDAASQRFHTLCAPLFQLGGLQ